MWAWERGGWRWQTLVSMDDEMCTNSLVSLRYLYLPAPVQKVQALGTAKKLAFHRACENAFSKVVITVLPSGKVGVQVGRQATCSPHVPVLSALIPSITV